MRISRILSLVFFMGTVTSVLLAADLVGLRGVRGCRNFLQYGRPRRTERPHR